MTSDEMQGYIGQTILVRQTDHGKDMSSLISTRSYVDCIQIITSSCNGIAFKVRIGDSGHKRWIDDADYSHWKFVDLLPDSVLEDA